MITTTAKINQLPTLPYLIAALRKQKTLIQTVKTTANIPKNHGENTMTRPQYDGKAIFALMRKTGVTMRQLKAKSGLTLKRMREVRKTGLTYQAARDWIQAITGEDPGELPHPFSCDCSNCTQVAHLTTSTALKRQRTNHRLYQN